MQQWTITADAAQIGGITRDDICPHVNTACAPYLLHKLCSTCHLINAGAPTADAEPAALAADGAAEAADDETAEEGGKVCISVSVQGAATCVMACPY
jgi:hypothetical protein